MANICVPYECLADNKGTRGQYSGRIATFRLPKKKPELFEKLIRFIDHLDWSSASFSFILETIFLRQLVAREVRDCSK